MYIQGHIHTHMHVPYHIPHTHTHTYAYTHMQRNYRTVEQSRHMLTLCKKFEISLKPNNTTGSFKMLAIGSTPQNEKYPPTHTHHKLTDFENIYSCHTPKKDTLSDNWLQRSAYLC